LFKAREMASERGGELYFLRIKRPIAQRAFRLLEKIAETAGKKERIEAIYSNVFYSIASLRDPKEAAKEFVMIHNDYSLMRDRLCAAYARDIKIDSFGKRDDRKVDLAFQKIAKQEGLAGYWYEGFAYGAAEMLIWFAAEDLKKRQKLHDSAYERGIAYERDVVDNLKSIDENASLTSSGADFGVDVTFRYRNRLFAGQCKALAKPAGVSAVREIVLGAKHVQAQHAVLFSASGFTDNALQLATTNKVICIEGVDLSSLDLQLVALSGA